MPIAWKPENVLLISKPCLHCGGEFHPRINKPSATQPHARLISRPMWAARRYCSIRCAKLHFNPVGTPEVRKKLSDGHKAKGYFPKVRGGNGRPLPPVVANMLAILGDGWEPEVAIPTKKPRVKGGGYPTCYKLDIGNLGLRIGIECDGNSHTMYGRKAADAKKDLLLSGLGWKVIRIRNELAAELCTTCKSAGTLLTSLGVS